MQGNAEVIELLNEVLTAELTAINQYFIHAKMCENWGYEKLAKKTYDESIDEMRDAEKVIERILYLDGVPNLQRLGSVGWGSRSRSSTGSAWSSRSTPSSATTEAWSWPAGRVTTAPPRCSRISSPGRRTTPTGWRRSSC